MSQKSDILIAKRKALLERLHAESQQEHYLPESSKFLMFKSRSRTKTEWISSVLGIVLTVLAITAIVLFAMYLGTGA
ncbi:hypothetical protein [Mycoplasma sp. Ms02]|uniref:hypothetical protein n=1 Tax=Mycoplasma sp. Ms02 TaxID=353851 RepID=UPI001C89D103|nr:hypothetical protein [Mycoplasma sp. Ms02]QZE12332.1 hypothetical protein K4L35_03295 [Mycoplasma sp. Ms02]